MNNARRYGRFTLPASLVHRFHTAAKLVMGQCIVFRAEHLFSNDTIEYWAASEHFRPVPLGEVIPEYRWIFSDTDRPRAEELSASSTAHGVPERVMSPDSKRNNTVGNDRANPQEQ